MIQRTTNLTVFFVSIVLLGCGTTTPKPVTAQPDPRPNPRPGPTAPVEPQVDPSAEAERLRAEGTALLADWRYEEAISKLTESLAYERDSEASYVGLLTAQLRLNQLRQAANTGERARQAVPSSQRLVVLSARALLASRRESEARTLVEDWLAAHPDDVAMKNMGVEIRIAMGLHQQAVRDSAEILKDDETNIGAIRNIARAYLAQGKADLALYVIERGRDTNRELKRKEDPVLLYLKGQIHIQRKQWQLAVAALTECVEVAPNYANALNNLGVVYQEVGDYPSAQATLARATRVAPGYRNAYLNLGNSYRGLKQFVKARAAYETALKLDEQFAPAWFNLGILFFDQSVEGMDDEERLQLAVKHFNRYKLAAAARLPKNDPVDDYIAEAGRMIEAARQAKEEQLKNPDPTPEDGATEGTTGDDGATGGDRDSERTPAEPESGAPTQPAPTEPLPTQPAPTEPLPTEPTPDTPTQPAPTEPLPTEPTPDTPTKPAPKPVQPAPIQPLPEPEPEPQPMEPLPIEPLPEDVPIPDESASASPFGPTFSALLRRVSEDLLK